MKKTTSGFTIVEIIVVIVIIGVLAAITILSYDRIESHKRDVQRVSKTTVLATALEKYYDENNEYPSCSAVSGPAATVITTLLPGLDADILQSPGRPSGETNSIRCSDLTAGNDGSDYFSYTGDSSADCASGVACLAWTIKYKEEATGEVKTIKSLRQAESYTSGTIALTATATGQSSINLQWNAVSGAVSYNIERSLNSSLTNNTNSSSTTASSLQTGLAPGTTYYFHVQPVTTTNVGSFSNTASATTNQLSKPSLSVSPASSRAAMTVTWSAISGANQYIIQRATNSGFTAGLQSFTQTTVNLTDSGVTPGTTYFYRAKAINTTNNGDSDWSSTASSKIAWICSDKGYQGAYPACTLIFDSINGNVRVNCATTDGVAYCWGKDQAAGYGYSGIINSSTPAKLPVGEIGAKVVSSVSADSGGGCAIAEGGLYCWGAMRDGFGNTYYNSTTKASTPKRVTGGLESMTVTDFSVAANNTCAVANGGAYCWGNNNYGQLGNGSSGNIVFTPTRVGGLLSGKVVTAITSDLQSTCAIAGGSAYCWGYNTQNELGNGTNTQSNSPVAVGGLSGRTLTQINMSNSHTCVLATTGAASCWGWGYVNYDNTIPNNRFASGSFAQSSTAVAIPQSSGAFGSQAITDVRSSTGWTRCVLAANNNAYCWGEGYAGRLGNGSTASSTSPVQVVRDTNIIGSRSISQLSGHCVLAGGDAFCWGMNDSGQLGNGTTTAQSRPVEATATAPSF